MGDPSLLKATACQYIRGQAGDEKGRGAHASGGGPDLYGRQPRPFKVRIASAAWRYYLDLKFQSMIPKSGYRFSDKIMLNKI